MIQEPFSHQCLYIQGELRQRAEKNLHRIKSDPPYNFDYLLNDLLEKPRSHSWTAHPNVWQHTGQQAGRYINSIMELGSILGERLHHILPLIESILKLQKENGDFGHDLITDKKSFKDPFRHFSGLSHLIDAFVNIYQYFRHNDSLNAAIRLSRYLSNAWEKLDREAWEKRPGWGSWACMCLPGVSGIYKHVKDEELRSFAERMAEKTLKYGHFHSHHFLSSYRGIIKWYEQTGQQRWLNKALKCWSSVKESILPTGGICECFPISRRDEGCSESDLIMFALGLYRNLGNPKFIEVAESCWLNHLRALQVPNGGFTFREDVNKGVLRKVLYDNRDEAYHCCTHHAARAMADLSKHALTWNGSTLCVNLYFPLNASWLGSEGREKNSLSIQGEWPFDENITVLLRSLEPLHLRMRIPSTTSNPRFTINDEVQKIVEGEDFVEVEISKAKLELHLPCEFYSRESNIIIGSDESKTLSGRSYHYGPLCLSSGIEEDKASLHPMGKVDWKRTANIRFLHF